MLDVSGKSRVCGLIGDPVEHTISPAMHNAAFRRLGLDFVYVPFRVSPDKLPQAVEGIRALNIKGVNVTIPHKVSIMALLDQVDALAERIGAVNTVLNDNGVLRGFNTDAAGFLQALLQNGVNPEGKRVVIIGAGGAARAICFALIERKASLTILNRGPVRGGELAGRLANTGASISALELNPANLAAALSRADLLVNATSLGMSPDTGVSPVPAALLHSGLAVFDAVYNPLQTRLLKDAGKAGARAISGLDMLVWQGALAFEKWTERKSPIDLMKEEARKALGL